MGFLRLIGAFVAATVVGTLLAVIAQSLFVVLGLNAVGAEIDAGEGAAMIVQDLAGLGGIYSIFITLGFVIAFLAAAAVNRLTGLRPIVFAAAGAVAMAVMLIAMEQVFFGIPLIAGARTLLGFMAQMGAGFVAGLVFAGLSASPRST